MTGLLENAMAWSLLSLLHSFDHLQHAMHIFHLTSHYLASKI